MITLRKNKVLNLTPHTATPEQVALGVVEPTTKMQLVKIQHFLDLPDKEAIMQAAIAIADLAHAEIFGDDEYHPLNANSPRAMIGGNAPFLLSELEKQLKASGIRPVYSYYIRGIAQYGWIVV